LCAAGLLLLKNKPAKNSNIKDQFFLYYLTVVGLLAIGIGELVTYAIVVAHS
jgi:hypothetical protein